MVIAGQVLMYVKDQHKRSIALPSTARICVHGPIGTDGRRWLLGDTLGGLYMLLLRATERGSVTEIQLQRLGEVRGACALTPVRGRRSRCAPLHAEPPWRVHPSP